MRMRAVLLIALLIGGTYAMLESINDYYEKSFNELYEAMNADFDSLTFNKPAMNGSPAETWKVKDELEVDELLNFLQKYSVKKSNQRTLILTVLLMSCQLVYKTQKGIA